MDTRCPCGALHGVHCPACPANPQLRGRARMGDHLPGQHPAERQVLWFVASVAAFGSFVLTWCISVWVLAVLFDWQVNPAANVALIPAVLAAGAAFVLAARVVRHDLDTQRCGVCWIELDEDGRHPGPDEQDG